MTKQPHETPPTKGRGDSQKRPKGMGGVFIIMLLLLALFLVVNRSGETTKRTNYDFLHKLVTGQLTKVTIESDDHVVGKFRRKDNREGQIETDFKAKIENKFNKMIESAAEQPATGNQ